jgi:hypothetical protein
MVPAGSNGREPNRPAFWQTRPFTLRDHFVSLDPVAWLQWNLNFGNKNMQSNIAVSAAFFLSASLLAAELARQGFRGVEEIHNFLPGPLCVLALGFANMSFMMPVKSAAALLQQAVPKELRLNHPSFRLIQF